MLFGLKNLGAINAFSLADVPDAIKFFSISANFKFFELSKSKNMLPARPPPMIATSKITGYLPMQKVEKILPNNSSFVFSPNS